MAKSKGIIKAIEDIISDSTTTAKPLKILIVGAEAAPYATVGGFASVLGYLSRELAKLDHDVRLFIPKFGSIDEEKYETETVVKGLKVPTSDDGTKYLVCNVKKALAPVGVPVYFLENQEYYEKRANVYGYSDDATRWALLSRGVVEFIKTEEFVPDVIHCNDWHTGLIPNYLAKDYKKDKILRGVASVFTIHNLGFQGMFDHNNVLETDLDDGRSDVASFFSPRLNSQNFMRRGVLYADAVNTVSKKYAKEVLTPEFGEGLDKLLLELKEKFFGIVNGLDYNEFNPKTDKFIRKNYDVHSLSDRAVNKAELQEEFDLPVNPKIPVFGFVGRLGFQKGVDLIIETMYHAMKDYNLQFVQVGNGDAHLIDELHKLKQTFPDKVGIHPYYNSTLPRLVFAGADSILYPSRFEPCGIVQLEAMRFGAPPIVRNVGGLADTVTNFDSDTFEGTGFVFNEFDVFSLYGQVIRVVELLKHPDIWHRVQKNAMTSDYSWKHSAQQYIKLYEYAISFKSRKNATGDAGSAGTD